MTEREYRTDLVVLVADQTMELSVRGLVARQESLVIRHITSDVFRHPEHDAGCRSRGHLFLKSYAKTHAHAIVMFDREGSGREKALTRVELEREVEANLSCSGWSDRAAAIVIDPELEAWFWSDSPHVSSVLGWCGTSGENLRDWLSEKGFLDADRPKPDRPKEAVLDVLKETRKPLSAALYRELAEKVSLNRCHDPAFLKFKQKIRKWFPG